MKPKIRPCKKGCGYPALKGRQFCKWHALMREAPQVQVQAAFARSAQQTAVHRARVPKEEWPPGERWCAGCQSFVPLFYTSGSRCKACAGAASHGARVEKTYGISAERYDELFRIQGGRCAICGNQPRTQRLAVDHDHGTGEVRGLCCVKCNHDLLGGARDNLAILKAAVRYLEDPPASGRWDPSARPSRGGSARRTDPPPPLDPPF